MTTKQTVLIVDDMPTNLAMLGSALHNDYTVRVATNGKEAISIAKSDTPPDIILLDIMMPDMSGYDVCIELKKKSPEKDIPIIIITAIDDEKDEEYGLSIGAIDFVTKPFSVPVLKARIKNHLELKKYRDMLLNKE